MTFDDFKKSSQGQRTFKWFYLIIGASYNQSLYEIHIVSLWAFSLPYNIWPLMQLKGQVKVIEFSVGYIS